MLGGRPVNWLSVVTNSPEGRQASNWKTSYHFHIIFNQAMFVYLSYLMLSVPDASCAGDNPLGGQHLRNLTLNVCAPFYIVSHYLHSTAYLCFVNLYNVP